VHELSIAQAVVDIALRCAPDRRVARVEVKVGHLRQVVPSALAFSFELVAMGTPAEGAELVIDEVPARVSCRECGAVSSVAGWPLACAGCDGLHVDVIAGDELLVDAVEVDVEELSLQDLAKGR
jgi:hydrogenase nickel incorporation protein HypA/HybF